MDMEKHAHAGRLPTEELWECERCKELIDPFHDEGEPPYCERCRREIHDDHTSGDVFVVSIGRKANGSNVV